MEFATITIIGLWIAYGMDTVMGDPEKWPHPIIYFGNIISYFEKRFNNGNYKILKGGILVFILCFICFTLFYFIENEILIINKYLYLIYFIIFAFFGLANTTLINEGKAIFNILQNNGIVNIFWLSKAVATQGSLNGKMKSLIGNSHKRTYRIVTYNIQRLYKICLYNLR